MDAPPVTQSVSKLLAYGSMAMPLCLAEIPALLYLPAFYAQEFHLSAALVGFVFLATRCWDGLSDLLIGWLSDRSVSRFGRRKPWVIAGAPLLILSTWLLCVPTGGRGLGYLLVWSVLFFTSFTAVKIPHLSWGTELSTDYVERSRVTGYREAFTMIGNLLFAALPLLFLAPDAPLRQVLLLITISIVCTVPPATILLTFVRDPKPTAVVETKILKEFLEILKDKVFVQFQIARLLYAVEEGISNSLVVFSIDVGLNLPNALFSLVFLIYIATLTALPITLHISRRVQKHWLLAAGIGAQSLILGLLALIPTGHYWIAALLYVIMGLANSAMLVVPYSILADIIDNGEVMNGERRSGAYVALDNLVYKIGMALGVGIAFGLLALLHYDPGAAHHDSADMRHIVLLGYALPCVLLLPSVFMYLRHPISWAVQRQLRATIDARRLAGGH